MTKLVGGWERNMMAYELAGMPTPRLGMFP